MKLDLDTLLEQAPFTQEDQAELGLLLQNKALLRALGELARTARSWDTLLGLELAAPGAIAVAARRQGEALGGWRMLNYLLELGESNDSGTDSTEPG